MRLFLLSALFYACNSNSNVVINEKIAAFETTLPVVDTTTNIVIPNILTNAIDQGFSTHEDTLFLNNLKYNGYVYKLNNNQDTLFIGSYYKGIEEGIHKKWYSNKQIAEIRFYHLGKKMGKHIGFWENGNPKFEFYFTNGEHQGIAKEWYNNGKPYRTFHYEKGYEEGSQKMWWENGTIRANYVVKNGRRYGLIGLKLCMNQNDTLKKEIRSKKRNLKL